MIGPCKRCGGSLVYEPTVGLALSDPAYVFSCILCGEIVYGPSRVDRFKQIAEAVPVAPRGRPRKQEGLLE